MRKESYANRPSEQNFWCGYFSQTYFSQQKKPCHVAKPLMLGCIDTHPRSNVSHPNQIFPQFCRAKHTTSCPQHHRLHSSHTPALPCSSPYPLSEDALKQAVRSLGRLRCTCYQASTCRLSTRFSSWDLRGELILGPASRLDAFSAYPFLT